MMDPKSLSKSIAAREESLNEEREQEKVILVNLGQALYDAGRGGEAPDNLIAGVDDATAKIREMEETLRQLLAEEEGRKDRLDEARTLKVEVRNINNRRESAFEELGRSVWAYWKTGRQQDPSIGEALTDLVRADEKIQEAEVAAFRSENAAGKKDNFLSRSKALLLAGRKRSAAASLEKNWAKTGRRVYEHVDSSLLDDSASKTALATLAALDRRIEEIRERQDILSTELEEVEKTLEGMPGKGTVRKRVSWLEKSIDETRILLDEAFVALGRGWMNVCGSKASSGGVERWRAESLELAGRIQKLEEDIEAFHAHQKYLLSDADREKKARKVLKLEREVKEIQTQLKLEKKELAAREKDLTKMAESLPALPEEV